mmetsp:Transcript_16481/g.23436  ORF Transcript_16481/g.23436 Transcript_16481/m.23436 type:complete len:230 (-) Transcript_16481:806-1495(-)
MYTNLYLIYLLWSLCPLLKANTDQPVPELGQVIEDKAKVERKESVQSTFLRPLLRGTIKSFFQSPTFSCKSKSQCNCMLQSTICKDHQCSIHCQSYQTPLDKTCYNGSSIIDKDNHNYHPFGPYDIMDQVHYYAGIEHDIYDNNHNEKNRVDDKHNPIPPGLAFTRYFYSSQNSTCLGEPTDAFKALPIGKCIGPFGPPLPWGRFDIICYDSSDNMNNNANESKTKVAS